MAFLLLHNYTDFIILKLQNPNKKDDMTILIIKRVN